MANFNAIWQKVVTDSPFSVDIVYKIGTHNKKTIKAIINEDATEYETAEFTIDILDNIELGDNVEFIIDEKVYKIVTYKKYPDIGLIKVWLNGEY